MSLTEHEWHRRFQQQAVWTKELRDYLFPRAGLAEAQRVIEIGCGTGAVLSALQGQTNADVHGLDINRAYLSRTHQQTSAFHLTQGDAHKLPYQSGSFDLTFCHFLLLWLEIPARAFEEMVRVTRSGGAILALAEPDYGGRIDHPDNLSALGALQTEALRRQGADPFLGRRLGAIFHEAGLSGIEVGVLGGNWPGSPSPKEIETEWMVLRADLQEMLSPKELDVYEARDREAWSRGERTLYVPTFYAWGIKE